MSIKKSTLIQRLHIDMPLLLGLIALIVTGLIVLSSAGTQNTGLVEKQIIRIVLSFGVLFCFAQISPLYLRLFAPWVFGITLLLLLAVLIIGDMGKGAQRWLNFGFFRFQPAEIMKLSLPLMLAYYLSERSLPPNIRITFVAFLIILVPTLLIAKQPDLGTSLLVASTGCFLLFLAGLSWRFIAGITLTGAILAPILWHVLHDYQKQRVLTFINPENDPLGDGYQIIQSIIAIGSGGLYGKGWFQGTQSHLEFLPERSTDFIFAVFGEEFGLVGSITLMLIYLFILYRGIYISINAQDNFNRLVAGSITLAFFFYIFVNIGMVSGLLPVVGVPLPLISYGGTSMVTLMAGFGILMSIQTHRKLLAN